MKRAYRNLADYLSQTGTTQAEFAEKVDCSQPVVSMVVRGLVSPGFRLAARMAAEAHIPIESLLPAREPSRRSEATT